MEIAFAIGLFFTTLMVVLGLAGEYKKGDWWKRNLHVFEMLVVLGVAGEMVTETGAFWYSLRLQAIEELAIVGAQQTADNSVVEAGKLGVTVDNLHEFVTQKEGEADHQLNALKAYVAAEEVRNAGIITELKNDKDSLDKARNDAVASVTAAHKILADMTAELDAEREVRGELLIKIAPRDLSAAQVETIGAALRPFSGQHWTVATYWNSKEPLGLTNKIFTALAAAGWQYDDEGTKGVLMGGFEGVLVYVHPQASPRAKSAANALIASLNAEQISAMLKEQNNPSNPNDKLELVVGSKP
jgi:hypothetical protein